MKEKVKALWKLCFEDSDEFIDMYFRLRYSDEINIAIESEGQVISALQMIPYPMTFCGHTVRTSYISGACTHPDFRGKSIMRELLLQAFTRMSHNGILFSTLIPAEPWLFDYYERMGYAPVFLYSIDKITVPERTLSKEVKVSCVSEYQEEVYRYLSRKLSDRPCYVQHTQEDFQTIMGDLSVNNGMLLITHQENGISGIAILYQDDEYLVIHELFAENKEAENSLLCYIKHHADGKSVIRLSPSDNNRPEHRLGMARIIHAKEVLQLYAVAFPKDEMRLKLSDEQLPENNGYYYLREGACIFSIAPLPGTHIPMNISELTNRIFQSLQPYMSLMMN